MKLQGATMHVHLKILSWSGGEEGGIPCVVAVRVDIRRNTSGEGGLMAVN